MMSLKTPVIVALSALLAITTGCNGNDAGAQAEPHLQRAAVYAEQGQYRSALIEIRNAVQVDPGNIDHALRLADIYLATGASTFAVETLQPWLEQGGAQVALPLADAFLLQGKFVSAGEVIQNLSGLNTVQSLHLARIQADIIRLSGAHSEAIEQYRSILEQSPAYVTAARGLATSLIRSDQADAAVQFITNWIQTHHSDAELLYLKGLVQYQFNELEMASSTLTDALAEVPPSDTFLPIRRQILSLLSRTSTELGEMTQAQVYNQILIENTNQALQRGTETALSAIAEGDLITARSTLETLMQQNPDNNLIGMLLGAVSLQQGEIEQGGSLLSESLDAETSPTPFIQLSTMAQIERGRREQALSTLERALLARPSDVELLAMHGVLALADPATANAGQISLTKALQIDPARSRLRMALAQHYLSEGQTEQALGQLRSAYTNNPTDWPVTDFYMSTLLQNSLSSEARELRKKLDADYSNEPFANLLVAMADHQFGNTDAAIERLEEITANASNSWNMADLALAGLYQASGRDELAIRSYLIASNKSPDTITPMQRAARLYAANNSSEEMIRWLTEIPERYTALQDNADALLASLYLQMGNLPEARRVAMTGEAGFENPYLQSVKGQILVAEAQQDSQNGQYSDARAKLAEAISLQPSNLNPQLLMVRLLVAEGSQDEAQSLLDQINNEFGDQPPVLVTRSQLMELTEGAQSAYEYIERQWSERSIPALAPEVIRLSRQVAPEETLDHARRWTDLQPSNPQSWQLLGDLYQGLSNDAAAEQAYNEVLQRQPNNIAALNNLAWVLKTEQPTEAVALAARAAELAPQNPAILDTYGWVLHLDGQSQEAIEVLRRALDLDPDNEEIREHLTSVQSDI